MRNLFGYAAFGGALHLVDAKALKWSPDDDEKRWTPPQETLGFMPALGMNGVEGPPAPAPTSPPILDVRHLRPRGKEDNTCGYINGIESNSMWCPTSQFCAYNSINSHIGCCDDASSIAGCNVWTTCLASNEKSKYTTDNGLTLWCGFTDYPNCLTHVYQGDASGYTLLGCGVAAGTDKIFRQTISQSSTSSFTPTATAPSRPSTSTPANGLGPNATNPPVPQSSSSSSTPIGPIVGGVVGGVAALALLALGIFFLVRSNNKRKGNIAPPTVAAPPPAPAPAPGGQGPPPPMTQQPQSYYDPSAAGFAHLDPRASVSKPPYYDQGISPPSSPPPPAHSPAPMYSAAQNNTPSPPPGGYPQGAYPPQGQRGYSPQQQQQGMYSQQGGAYSPQQQQQQQGYPQQQQQGYSQQQQQQHPYGYQQQPPQQQFIAELPTQRGDGEVRELAG